MKVTSVLVLFASIGCTVSGFGLPSAPLAALQKNVGAGTMNAFAQPTGLAKKGTSLVSESFISMAFMYGAFIRTFLNRPFFSKYFRLLAAKSLVVVL